MTALAAAAPRATANPPRRACVSCGADGRAQRPAGRRSAAILATVLRYTVGAQLCGDPGVPLRARLPQNGAEGSGRGRAARGCGRGRAAGTSSREAEDAAAGTERRTANPMSSRTARLTPSRQRGCTETSMDSTVGLGCQGLRNAIDDTWGLWQRTQPV